MARSFTGRARAISNPARGVRLASLGRNTLLALTLAAAVPWPTASRAATEAPSELRIASEGARPPFNYLDGNELAGFEIDLGRELCARMKVTCSFVMQDWDHLVPGLIQHQYDAVMAAMEITDEARAKVAFTTPYVRMPSAFMAARDSGITSTAPAVIQGKRIGVEADSAHETYAEEVLRLSEVVPFASLEEAILDLAEGRVELVLADKDALVDFAKTRREAQCCKLVGDVAHDPAYFGEGIGIALRPEDKALLRMFDKALAEVRADGTFERIRARYFDFEID